MVLAYRNDEDVLQARLGALIENRSAAMSQLSAGPRAVYARRFARAVAGGVASLGGVALFAGGILTWLGGASLVFSGSAGTGKLVGILAGSVLAGVASYLPARAFAARAYDRAMHAALSLSGNVRVDLVRVERAQPHRVARSLAERHEALSAALPLIAAALLAPLAIHLLVWLLVVAASPGSNFSKFDAWIVMSMPIAGTAHVVLALLAALFGLRLAGKATEELRSSPAKDGWRALGITALAGMFPGALLILIPPVVIGATGLAFIPLSFYRMSKAIVRERDVVDALAD